ncbi:helix-turn-helix domain-containing protein [Sphingomonas carotinifaciens]
MRFGKRVGRLAKRSGLSVDELADRAELSTSRMEDVLHGRQNCVTLREMNVIARALAAPLPDLLAPSDDWDRGARGS